MADKKDKKDYTREDYIKELNDDELAKISEIFDLFDKNLDGGVDSKELRFILNSLEIYPNHDELSSMMQEADSDNKGFINEDDFKYIIAKQKVDYKDKLIKEATDAFVALGGDVSLNGKIQTSKIQKILREEFELSEELEASLRKIASNKEEITFEEFMKFFQ